jgi:hypothetical protein
MMKVVFILVLVPMYDVSENDVSTYQCTVLLYHISMYWRLYVCMYRLKYMYQSIRSNSIIIGKEGKNKMYLES